MEIIAVKGPVAAISTDASIFQVNVSKIRRPLDTVDLEEPPDSRERAGALVSLLSCEGQTDVNGCLTIHVWGAILDRQGLQVAAPADLRNKNIEHFSPLLLKGFWSKLKFKNPKIVVMSPTVTAQNSKQKEVVWQQYRLCLVVAEHQILGGECASFFWDQNQERFGG